MTMQRRAFLAQAGLGAAMAATFPWKRAFGRSADARILYFTRSAGFEHSPVRPGPDGLSLSDKALIKLGKQYGVEVVCTKDGSVFDGDLDQFDCIAFYTAGNLDNPKSKQNTPPITERGKERFLRAIHDGMPFVGFHSATDTWKTPGPRNENQTELDPYIEMIGGQFIVHGKQQDGKMVITKPVELPCLKDKGDSFTLFEEWYALKNFDPNMHVILVQDTEGMEGECYQRPSFPATWAKKYGNGRVFYTSIGHRDELWEDPFFLEMVVDAFSWAMGEYDIDLTPNLKEVATKAHILPGN